MHSLQNKQHKTLGQFLSIVAHNLQHLHVLLYYIANEMFAVRSTDTYKFLNSNRLLIRYC